MGLLIICVLSLFTYDLCNLQGQYMGFHDLILTLNCKRDSNPCISSGNISQIFGPKYKMLSKPLCTV